MHFSAFIILLKSKMKEDFAMERCATSEKNNF